MADKQKSRFEISRECQEEFVNSVAEQMAELAKEGQPWVKPWTSNMGFPFNPVTGREYSGANMIRLMLTGVAKRYNDDRWVTFKQLNSFVDENGLDSKDVHVRKGEKGTRILRPEEIHYIVSDDGKWVFPKKEELEQIANDKAAGKPTPEVKTAILFYTHTVFNASQIEGFPPKSNSEQKKTEIERNEFVERFVACSGIPVKHHEGEAYYKESKDMVSLPLPEKFVSSEEYYATKLHEFYHATGHKNRENRFEDKSAKAYAFEEMRAEMFSMLTGAHLDLPMPIHNSAAYIGNWNQKFSGGEAKAVFKAATDAAKVLTTLREFEAGTQPTAAWYPKSSDWDRLQQVQAERDAASLPSSIMPLPTKHALRNVQQSLPELPEKTFLDVPYAEKDEAKNEGARWDPAEKKWYISDLKDATRFNKWMKTHDKETKNPDEVSIVRMLQENTLEKFVANENDYFKLQNIENIMRSMLPLNTLNEFWNRHNLPNDVDSVERRIATTMDAISDREIPHSRESQKDSKRSRMRMG